MKELCNILCEMCVCDICGGNLIDKSESKKIEFKNNDIDDISAKIEIVCKECGTIYDSIKLSTNDCENGSIKLKLLKKEDKIEFNPNDTRCIEKIYEIMEEVFPNDDKVKTNSLYNKNIFMDRLVYYIKKKK